MLHKFLRMMLMYSETKIKFERHYGFVFEILKIIFFTFYKKSLNTNFCLQHTFVFLCLAQFPSVIEQKK